jgi:branched-chain amino acid transport system substrate-binding protein
MSPERSSRCRLVGAGLLAAVLAPILSPSQAVAQQPAKAGIVIELTGGGAPVGTMWKNGVQMAVDEINQAGGILGRKVETFALDTQSDPPTSVAVMKRAVAEKPFVILGPIYSSSTKANMVVAQEAGIPQITGSEALELSRQGDPFFFRTSFGQDVGMAKLVKWLLDDLKLDRIALIYVNNAFGKGGRDVVIQYLKARGKALAADISTEVQQADFTAELTRAKNSGANALMLYLHEEESARAIRQVRKLGLGMEVVGETTLCTQTTINAAGDEINGVKCHVGLSPDAPVPAIQAMARKFDERFKGKPDHNGIKGYLGMYMVKAAVEKVGGFGDGKKLADCLHNQFFSARQTPGVLLDVYVDERGDMDRQSFLVEVKNRRQEIVKVLPMLQGPYQARACAK